MFGLDQERESDETSEEEFEKDHVEERINDNGNVVLLRSGSSNIPVICIETQTTSEAFTSEHNFNEVNDDGVSNHDEIDGVEVVEIDNEVDIDPNVSKVSIRKRKLFSTNINFLDQETTEDDGLI